MSVYDRYPAPEAPDLRDLIFPTIDDLTAAPLPEHLDAAGLDPCGGWDWTERLAPNGHWRFKCTRVFKDMRPAPKFKIFESGEARRDAIDSIPLAWRAFCPSADATTDPWNELGGDRVRDLYNDKKGVSFQKAALVYWLLVRHVQCYLGGDTNEIFNHVKITPLIYTVDGFTKDFFNKLDLDKKKGIAIRVGGQSLATLEKMPRSALTFCAAIDMYNFLSPTFPAIAGIEIDDASRRRICRTQRITCRHVREPT